MRPHGSLHTFAAPGLLVLLAAVLPDRVSGQPPPPGSLDLAPEVRERLLHAADDRQLSPWQREIMLQVANGDGAPVLDSEATNAQQPLPECALDATEGSWDELVVSARGFHSAIYDPLRARIVVFGGPAYSCAVNDVWALSLAGTPAWKKLTPTGTPPSARYVHSAIYDPVRDRMVVFGGNGESGLLNDVWALSLEGPEWTQLTPTGAPPVARGRHSAIYDPLRERMVVFGGEGNSGLLNDVWALSLAGSPVWLALSPSGTPPAARAWHSGIYDPIRDRMVVFGGGYYDEDGFLNYFDDTSALSLADPPAWIALAPGGAPPTARAYHSAVYDPVRDCMVVFGGGYYDDGGGLYYFDDTSALLLADPPAWTPLSPSGTLPAARGCHSAIYDPVLDRMVVVAGHDASSHSYLNDVWGLSLAGAPSWTALTPTGPPPSGRQDHSAIHDPVRDRMVVFGGDDGGYCGDVRALSLADPRAWTELTPVGTLPSIRQNHSAIYDAMRDRMVVFAGFNYLGRLSDVWVLSLGGVPAWTQLMPTDTLPSERSGHSAIYDALSDRMVVFGGVDSSWPPAYLNDVWALSLAGTPAWTELTPAGTPPGVRAYHSAIYDPLRGRMLVFGGYNGLGACGDVWALSLVGAAEWSQLTPAGTPPVAPSGHSAIYDPVRDRMVVFGGFGGGYRSDVWALSLAGLPVWTELTPTGPPPAARSGHSAIYDPARDRMVAFGGYAGCYFNDLWALTWGTPVDVDGRDTQALASCLHPPVPNPSSGTTAVSYAIAKGGRVQVAIYDVRGRLVRRLVDKDKHAGAESVAWDGTGDSGTKLGAGVYFVRLVGPGIQAMRRVVLLD